MNKLKVSVEPRLRKIAAHPLAYPLVLLVLGVGAYLLMAANLGFYWDDWQAIYLAQSTDSRLVWDYFAADRPFSAWTYKLTFPLLGLYPLAWQVCTLLIRWLGILTLENALEKVWPDLRYPLRWAGALLLTFPVFSLQFVSVAFNQHFITFTLFAVSLWFSVQASSNRRFPWLWSFLALATCLSHLFTMEYFAGLEIMRPVLMLVIRRRQGLSWRAASRRTLLDWLPIAAGLLFFGYWRFNYYPRHFPYEGENNLILLGEILKTPLDGLEKLAALFSRDTFFILFEVWLVNASPEVLELSTRVGLFAVGLGAALSILFAAYVEISVGKVSSEAPVYPRWWLVLLGLISLIAGGLPVWLAGRESTVGKWSDRFALAALVGAALLIAIVLNELVKTRWRGTVFSLLLCIAIATQVRAANKYRLDWEYQRDFYWQLAWRAPALPLGTAIFSWFTPTDKLADYPAAYALNTLYSPDGLSRQAPYWFFLPRSLGYHFARYAPDVPIQYSLRSITFTGNTSQAIGVVYRPARACLRLLEPAYRLDPRLEPDDLNLLPVSNPDVVIPKGKIPRQDVFGSEPDHNWCYFYQKADLARSRQEWTEVLSIMQGATTAGMIPKDGAEMLPLIEAYANTGQWQPALDASQRALQITGDLGNFLCSYWERYSQMEGGLSAALQAREAFGCQP